VREATAVLAGRYELGALIGRGGMADVHEGRDLLLGRPVAIKVLASPFDRDEGFVERFRNEARAVAPLSHPNIVAVFDTGSDGDRRFIVTELVDGESLSAVLAREGRLTAVRTVEIATQVCRALANAHEAGIVHRDVKPGNVMLAADGRVKVVDFGIAKAAGADAITRSGWVLGSAPYLAPEQASGFPADERTDLYALGCVMYHMLTGDPPFVADSPVATLYRHVNDRPPRPTVRVPEGLEAVVLRCLEKDPDRRFVSAAELERALAEVDVPAGTLPLPLLDADDPTAPVARTAGTAPIGVGEPTTPARTSRPTSASVRRHARGSRADRHRGRPMVPVAVAAAAIVAVAWLALDPLGGRAPLGTVARDRRTSSPSPTVTTSPSASDEGSSSAEGSFGTLLSAIGSGVEGGIAPDAARKLGEHAFKLQEHLQEGKIEDATRDAEEFLRELDRRTAEGQISPSVAGAIREAFQDLLASTGVTASSPDDHDDGDDDDDDD
jgi:serine/threonine-protein kinase